MPAKDLLLFCGVELDMAGDAERHVVADVGRPGNSGGALADLLKASLNPTLCKGLEGPLGSLGGALGVGARVGARRASPVPQGLVCAIVGGSVEVETRDCRSVLTQGKGNDIGGGGVGRQGRRPLV